MVECEPVPASDNPEEKMEKPSVLGISPSRKSSFAPESDVWLEFGSCPEFGTNPRSYEQGIDRVQF